MHSPVNLPNYNIFLLTLSHSIDIGMWHPMLQGQIGFSDLEYGSPLRRYNKPIGAIYMQNRFDLPWGIYAYLMGTWSSRGNNSVYYFYDNFNLSLMLSKSVGNWSFTLYGNDLCRTWRQKHMSITNGVNMLEYRKGASQCVQLSVTYSFKNKKKYKSTGTGSSELKRL